MKNIAWIKNVQDNHKCKVKLSNEREKVTWIIKLVSQIKNYYFFKLLF